jgi:hypothetical protein
MVKKQKTNQINQLKADNLALKELVKINREKVKKFDKMKQDFENSIQLILFVYLDLKLGTSAEDIMAGLCMHVKDIDKHSEIIIKKTEYEIEQVRKLKEKQDKIKRDELIEKLIDTNMSKEELEQIINKELNKEFLEQLVDEELSEQEEEIIREVLIQKRAKALLGDDFNEGQELIKKVMFQKKIEQLLNDEEFDKLAEFNEEQDKINKIIDGVGDIVEQTEYNKLCKEQVNDYQKFCEELTQNQELKKGLGSE